MKTRIRFIFISLILFIVCSILALPDSAHAGYIDSGSGSALVQVIIAAAAGVGKIWHSFCRTLGIKK